MTRSCNQYTSAVLLLRKRSDIRSPLRGTFLDPSGDLPGLYKVTKTNSQNYLQITKRREKRFNKLISKSWRCGRRN